MKRTISTAALILLLGYVGKLNATEVVGHPTEQELIAVDENPLRLTDDEGFIDQKELFTEADLDIKRTFEITPTISFGNDEGEIIGTLSWGDGVFRLEGNAEESAKVLIDHATKYWGLKCAEAKNK